MTTIWTPEIIVGYLAKIDDLRGADEEDRSRMFSTCFSEYTSHLQSIRAGLDPITASFVDKYILGTENRKGLHDECIENVRVVLHEDPSSAYAEISLSLSNTPNHKKLAVSYQVLKAWDASGCVADRLIDRHELIANGQFLQHTLYVVGGRPISFVFENLVYAEE